MTSRVIETLLLLKIETAVVLRLVIQMPLPNAPDGEEGEKTTMGFAAKANGNVDVAVPEAANGQLRSLYVDG